MTTFRVSFRRLLVVMSLAAPWIPVGASAEIPPAPPGYKNEVEVKQAYQSGKLRVINLAVEVPSTVAVERGIEYGKGGKTSLKLDLYSPKDRQQPSPGIVFIHGGAWKGGYRQMYHYYCTKFAERGYVAATISYRLTGEAPFPAAVEDAKCAVRWMRANAERLGVDPERIAVAGGSAGGHLAMLVGYTADVSSLEGAGGNPEVPSRVQAVISLYGPTDLTTEEARSEGDVSRFLGGKSYDEASDLYELASPIKHVTKDDAPTLILHGTIDSTVTIDHAERIAAELKAQGVPHEFDRIEGWPHVMDLEPDVNRHCVETMFAFLEKHLTKEPGKERKAK